jgi:hypothetical protein
LTLSSAFDLRGNQMATAVRTPSEVLTAVRALEDFETSLRPAAAALGRDEWAMCERPEQPGTYAVYYQDRLLTQGHDFLDSRDLVAREAALVRAGREAGGTYDPFTGEFVVGPGVDPQAAAAKFQLAVQAITLHPGV